METHPSLKEGHTSKDILSNDCATLAQLQTSELKLSQPKTTDFTFSQKLRGEICQATQSQLKMTPRALNLLPTPSLKKIDEEEEEEDELNTGKQKTKFYNSAERHIGIVEQEKNSRIFIRQNSALGSATNIAFSVAKEMLIGSEKSLLTRATSSFYESCSNPQNEKTVNTVNLLLGNVVSSVIPAQSIRRDFALNIAHQFSPPSATPLWGKQSKLFSIDNLPLAILIIILRFAVDPLLPNAKIYVAKWHCQRISVYNLRQLSRALKNAVPEALKLIDTRDISMKALQSLATASETEFAQIQPYQRRITITASIPSTATTKTSNPTTLTVPAAGLLFIQPPSQTVYTSPSQTFKPPILPSGRSVRTTITASYVIPTATGVDPPAAAATAAHATISVPFALHLQIDNDPVATATVRAILTLTVARAEQTQRVVELVDTSTGAWIGWIRYSEAEAPGYNYNVKHREVLECTWEREWWLGWAAKWAIGMPRHDREDILDRHFGHVASEIVLEEIVVPTDFVFGGFLKSVLE
ncbi:hypothetical protein HK100_010196 [Physocladia obscura]|uniref:Uncharacterized protein n=1 Tax=Physocladia obscura TaxID=109957 RepID=A0AAD5XH98_9FUNG|nr:hypothetical protein HK100_010196 [Physocladia obscura]